MKKLLLAFELLSSLRDTDVRIKELQSFIQCGQCRPECEEKIRERIKKLMETRFDLAFSLSTVKNDIIEFFSGDFKNYIKTSEDEEKIDG